MQEAKRILVKLWYGHIDSDSVRQWAYDFIRDNDDIPEEYFDLLDADKYSQETLLLSLVRQSEPGFNSQSVEAEISAAEYLIDLAEQYLIGNIEPIKICDIVQKIDSGFLGAPRNLPKGIAYYPEWLGDLYNSCDWCDESWSFDSKPHLKSELEKQVKIISEWVKCHNK